MKNLLLLFVLLSALTVQAQRRVILIIADDLGTDWCGFYPDHVDTANIPHLRSLANRGIRFDNAMSNPYCSSTRASIFTGKYAFRTGVGGVVGGMGGSNPLSTSELSIPKALKNYNPNIATANTGKWHLQVQALPNLDNPNIMGYDHYAGNFNGTLTSFYNWSKVTDGVVSTCTNYATTETVNDAITWLQAHYSQDFFLWLSFNAPHDPYHLPPAGMYSDVSLSGAPGDINNNPKKYFKAELEALDHEVGRMFDSLQTLNILDSIDFIFIGDNGNAQPSAQIADTSRAKGSLYQYGVHVPFVVAGPSVVNPGRSSDALVNLADIFATAQELMGNPNWQSQIPASDTSDSKSILPIIKNQSQNIRPWTFTEIFKTTTDSMDGKAMRNMDYKLIRFDYGGEEFYHLATDPSELVNLLLDTLSSEAATNYIYLCNQMSNLVGSGVFCTPGVSIESIQEDDESLVYPNPFSGYIHFKNPEKKGAYSLTNALGQTIFQGKDVEKQNFSTLPCGMYFLNASGGKTQKLIKQ